MKRKYFPSEIYTTMVRIPTSYYKVVRYIGKRQKRSVPQQMRLILEGYFDRRGVEVPRAAWTASNSH